ncbi:MULTISPECIES: hypothetical protein [Aerosakkonema]|uniref:hypothetical protein n=1 Tax=Aerosakkonema TaxID=1246629 RepID=UPI0035B91E08
MLRPSLTQPIQTDTISPIVQHFIPECETAEWAIVLASPVPHATDTNGHDITYNPRFYTGMRSPTEQGDRQLCHYRD